MDSESLWAGVQAGAFSPAGAEAAGAPSFFQEQFGSARPDASEQSRLFNLLGRINYIILRGDSVYLQVRGTVYKVIYGVYWQSVFSGRQHWGLRCAEVGHGAWAEDDAEAYINLPLRYTTAGWVIEAESSSCPLYGDLLAVNEADRGVS